MYAKICAGAHKLLYIAQTVACLPIYIVKRHWNGLIGFCAKNGIGDWSGWTDDICMTIMTTRAPEVLKGGDIRSI